MKGSRKAERHTAGWRSQTVGLWLTVFVRELTNGVTYRGGKPKFFPIQANRAPSKSFPSHCLCAPTSLAACVWPSETVLLIVSSQIMPKETKSKTAKPAATDAKKGEKKRERKKSNINTPITREATINLHKRVHGVYVMHLS